MGLPKPTRSYNSKNFENRKLNFLKLTEGQHLIRLLQPIEITLLKYTHWINGMSVECPGEDCPICINNREILASVDNSWEEARKIKSFNPYQVRYYANVLDRTLVKVAPSSESGFENKRLASGKWPQVCAETGEPLANVEPRQSNTVKILAGGKTLFGDLDSINKANLDDAGDEIGIHTYDVVLMVKGSGRDRSVTPVHQINRNDEVVLPEGEELYDLNRALVTLSPDEIQELRKGISLKDIFEARRITDSIAKPDTTVLEVLEEDTKDQAGKVSDFLDSLD